MNLLIPIEYGYDFTEKIINKFIKDITVKLYFENLDILSIWLRAEYGLGDDINCNDIILFALDNVKIRKLSKSYKIEFDSIIRYQDTGIRLITLLKTITYGTRYFKGNKLILNEIKMLKYNIKSMYNLYDRLGVVI